MVSFPSIVSLFLLIAKKRRAWFTKDFSLKFLSLSRSWLEDDPFEEHPLCARAMDRFNGKRKILGCQLTFD